LILINQSKEVLIERIIQRGNLKDWQIAFEMYGKDALLHTAQYGKQLSERDRNFTKILVDSPLINSKG
jgi:hypothetical protein